MASILKHISFWTLGTLACCQSYTSEAQTFSHVTDEVLQGVDINTFGCFAGCGVSFFDIDENGWDDLTFVGLDQPVTIFLNQEGIFSLFQTLPSTGEPKHPIWVDYDNDGDNDLFVSKYHGIPMLFRNDDMVFTNVSEEAGLPQNELQENFGACWGDYDLDGYLDLYIANFNDPTDDFSPTNVLLRNNGDGTFDDVTVAAGVGNGSLKSNGCSWMDFNQDGLPDLHVINDRDYNLNALYLNNGDGTFDDISTSSGADIGIFAMSSTVGDYDNDGWLDVYITNGPLVGNYLLKNIEGEVFFEQQIELDVQVFAMCWSAQWIDFNNDMWQDLYVAVRDWGALPEPNHFFINTEGTFSVAPDDIFPDDEFIGYANAIGDFNNDGYPDLLQYSDVNEPPALWVNSGSDNNYIKIDLTGTVSNRNGVGAWIDCYADGIRQIRYTYAGEDYLAQDSQYEIFGLGQAESIDSLIISWPSGIIDSYYDIAPNQTLELIEGLVAPSIIVGQDYICAGTSIELTTSGFDEFNWSTGDTTSTIEINQGGWYWVEGINSNGQSAFSDSTYISLLFAPPYSMESMDISCYGENDGSIIFSEYPEGTTYFEWQDGSSDSARIELTAGVYAVYVGSGPCTSQLEIEIAEPDSIILELSLVAPSCFGGNDGFAELTASGGTEPYLLDWSDDPSALAFGDYSVSLIDGNGCLAGSDFFIDQPEELVGSLDYTSLPGGEFLVTAWINGGTEPYDYNWSDGQSGESITTNGSEIEVVVTDANGCETVQMLNLVFVQDWNNIHVDVRPNPVRDELFINGLSIPFILRVTIHDMAGKLVLDKTDHPSDSPISVAQLPSGNYILELSGTDFVYQQQIIVRR